MCLEKDHDLSDFFLVFPGLFDHMDSFFANAIHFGQLLNLIFDDIERFFAEFGHNPLGHDWADAFDETGAQVLLDAIHRSGNRRLAVHYLELLTVFGMIGPLSPHLDNLAGHGGHEVTNDGYKVPLAVHFKFRYGVAVLRVGISDPLNQAL